MKYSSILYRLSIDERLFNILEQHYGDKQDNTMVNYVRFCDDLDVVFNLPVNIALPRIMRKNPL
jgi:hypothetical protein